MLSLTVTLSEVLKHTNYTTNGYKLPFSVGECKTCLDDRKGVVMDFHVTIDFPDDLLGAEYEWSEELLRELVCAYARRGVTALHMQSPGYPEDSDFKNVAPGRRRVCRSRARRWIRGLQHIRKRQRHAAES